MDVIEAAGALPWRASTTNTGDPEVLLVHRPKYDDWSLPKGKREPGEHVLTNAVRELDEETGIRGVLGRRLPTVRYKRDGRPKRVDYWAATVLAADAAAVPNSEVDRMAWLPLADARARLSYAHDAAVLDSFAAAPPATYPFILVRHASAGSKASWAKRHGPGDDQQRPLDEGGAADAAKLAGLLTYFAPSARVVSSAAERCLATMRPFAARAGAAVVTEEAFTLPGRSKHFSLPGGPGPSGARGRPPASAAPRASTARTDRGDSARRRITELVADAQPTIVCAHGENMPVLLAAACEAFGGAAPTGELTLPKGGFWVLHVGSGKLAGVERYVVSEE
jgi:8-oxo-dGTP diphosphatase